MLFKFIHNYVLPKDDRAISWINDLGNYGYLVEITHKYIKQYLDQAVNEGIITRINHIAMLIELKTYSVYYESEAV